MKLVVLDYSNSNVNIHNVDAKKRIRITSRRTWLQRI